MEKATEKSEDQTLKKIIIWIFGAIIMFSVAFIFSNYLKERSPNAGDSMLKVVSDIADETPDYPDFRRLDFNTSSRNTDACVYEYFQSKSIYSEIENHYTGYLLKNGWIKVSNEKFTFKKDKYWFYLENRPEKNADCNYGISICWKHQP